MSRANAFILVLAARFRLSSPVFTFSSFSLLVGIVGMGSSD